MKATHALLWLAVAACATQGKERHADAELPRAVSAAEVHGGETLSLRTADVSVLAVLFMNQPCPTGVQCITSGVARKVRFRVTDRVGGESDEATVSAGESRAVRGVLLRVLEVEDGPRAKIDLSEAVAPLAP